MTLFKIISSFFKKTGPCYSHLKNGSQASLCSAKGSSSGTTSQIHRIPPQVGPLGGSPISSDAMGQPTHITHPHKLVEGEVLPGIRLEEFQNRRYNLVKKIDIFASKNHLNKKTHLIIIPSSLKKYMTEAIPYVFRQNSDFLYLCGCLEPDSILVITKFGNEKQESTLFLRGKDYHAEIWDGPRTSMDQAVSFFGIDKSFPVTAFEPYIKSFIKEHADCILWYDYVNEIHPAVHKYLTTLSSICQNMKCESPRPFIHQLRLFKSPGEQELMKKTCEIGSNAIKTVIKNSKPLDNESELFARVDYECRINGAEYLAYPPVVASGNRTNIIHYINNDQIVNDGDMVLMDAGCEYRSYSSDITRTWPVSGRFSPPQRILYEVVCSVQTDLIELCNTFPSLDHLFSTMCKLLGLRMREAGIISNKYDEKDLARMALVFCPHHVSHYLGMDVHDTSSVPRNIPLKPGVVFTVEPGLYINFSNKLANPEFRGLGVRIEDDILMLNSGPLNLTSSCPKHPDEIESLKS